MPEGVVILDDSGARWLFPADGSPPRASDAIELGVEIRRWVDPRHGLVVIGPDGEVRASKTALGAYTHLATLPAGSDEQSFRAHDGVLTVREPRGVSSSTDGTIFTPVAPLATFLASEIILDARGHGVGLFLPQTVARTTDGGAHWTPVPADDLTVTSIGLVAGKPAVLPGSPRDRFARTVDPQTGGMERAIVREADEEVEAAKNPHLGEKRRGEDGAGATKGEPQPERFDVPASLFQGEFGRSFDGDRVLHLPRSAHGIRDEQPVRSGQLGEGLRPQALPLPLGCHPSTSALCGEVAAVACGRDLVVFRGNERVGTFPLDRGASIGFTPDGGLVSVAREAGTKRLALTSYELGPTPKVETHAIEGLEARAGHLLGGCHRPALWLSIGDQAARYETQGFGPAVDLPPTATPVGIDARRELVLAAWPDDKPSPLPYLAGAQLLFLPSGERVGTPLFYPDSVSFAEDGVHGLFVSREPRQLSQTDDGGRSWIAIETPRLTSNQRVLCGATRCQLGSGAFREGFVRDETYVAPKPTKASSSAEDLLDGPTPASPGTPLHVVLSCRADGGVFAGTPALGGPLSARLGELVFAATASDDDRPGTARTAVFGDVRGKLTTESLGKVGPHDGSIITPQTGEEALRVGAPGVIRRVVGRSRGPRANVDQTTTRYLWEPGAALQQLAEKDGGRSMLSDTNLVGEELFGQSTWQHTLAIWGKRKPVIRTFPADGVEGSGVLVIDARETVLVVVAHERGGSARLIELSADDGLVDRSLRVQLSPGRESGVGLFVGPDGARSVVLLESTEAGATELRIRPLDAGLHPGAATVVPGTRTAPGRLLALPSCAPGAKGALVRVTTQERLAAKIGEETVAGVLGRILRVTPAAACVERTALTEQSSLAGPLVVVGDGGLGAASVGATGVRCEAVDPRPLAELPVTRAPRK